MLENKKIDYFYFPTLDAMRGIASLGVVFCHYGGLGYLFPKENLLTKIFYQGTYGVHFFFVISGFIIPYSLWKNQYHIKNFFKFILKRSIRIDPPYYVTVLLMIKLDFIISLYSKTPFHFDIFQLLAHLFYYLPFTSYDFYDPLFWTLAIEFQYYIFIGLGFYFLTHKNKFYIHLFLLIFIFINTFEFNQKVFLPNYSCIFSVGILLFLHKSKILDDKYIYTYLLVSLSLIYFLSGYEIFIAVLLAFILINFFELKNKILSFLGKISYSLYLTHNLLRTIFLSNLFSSLFSLKEIGIYYQVIYFIVMILSSIVFSYIFYRIIEKPSLYFSKKVDIKNIS